ncbi:IS1/IS1595 family N-terminal zinc-binding domain-containing protein [Haemophilus paracuniculus]|uniref:IS1/IS1595 family N-terminal zinc-binding domain-containing protein n=1 Tax=Haemophilus paracuniculus TaxID=734 RepID=UPI000992F885|nr:hypothetical protein [Haemophilus paracuniculus]
MRKKSVKVEKLKEGFHQLPEKDKKQLYTEIAEYFAKLKMAEREVKCCPHCSGHFVKNGKSGGVQRYLCRKCERTFVGNTGTLFFKLKKGKMLSKNIFTV